MHAKIVIVVTRAFWSCSACKVHSKLSESIDQHMKVKHPDFDGADPGRLYSNSDQVENGGFSDSELDSKFHYRVVSYDQAAVPKLESQCKTSVHDESAQNGKIDMDVHNEINSNRRKSSRKQPKKAIKRQQTGTIGDAGDKAESEEDDTSSVLGINTDESEKEDENDQEWTATKRKLRAPKTRSLQKSSLASKQNKDKKTDVAAMKTRNKTIQQNKSKTTPLKEMKKEVSSADDKALNNSASSIARQAESGKNEGRGRKHRAGSDTHLSDFTELKMKIQPPMAKSKFLSKYDNQEGNESSKKRQQITTVSHQKNVSKSVSSSEKPNSNTIIKKTVDKSQIATCCAPWLFDSGRKAGDKVNKKPRRMLLPEEKEAVRELYGIPAFTQSDKTATLHTHLTDRRGYTNQPGNPSICLPPVTMDLMAPPPHCLSTGNKDDAIMSLRNYQMNMFQPGAHDYFPDSARTQENLYSGYGGMCQQQSEHQQFASQEFYPPSANTLQPRTYMNYSSFNQSGPLPTAGITGLQQQQANSSYPAQTFSVIGQSLSHSQDLPNQTPVSTISQIMQNTSSTAEVNIEARSQATQQSVQLPAAPITKEKGRTSDAAPLDSSKAESQEKQCTVCLEKFDTYSLLQKHACDTSVFETLECKRCKLKFHGMHQLNLHVFSEHETEKQGFCFTCNENTVGLENLEKHVYRHAFNKDCRLEDLKFHDCRICTEELQNSYPVVRTHYYQHHITHVCAECFQNFDDVDSYVEHCRKHEGKNMFCSICGHESSEKLQSHFPCAEDMWAEDGKGAQCSKCRLWCPNRAVVEAHRKQHRSQEDVEAYRKGAKQGFPCVSCEKVFKNKHACRRHIKMVHEGVSCYKHYCEYCGKGFLTKGHMRDHIALHHLHIKRYKCDYCNQQFVCGPTLRRHIRKEHTKHKPYKCEHCGERFFEKTPLQRHLTTHTGLAPFMCEHCGKGFYTKHSFTNHGTTHSTTRDFVCSGCQKGFTRKYNLQAHMKICKLV